MVVQIDGTNTLNKGAELMLCAIVEQLEKEWGVIDVIYNSNQLKEKKLVIKSNLNFKKRFSIPFARYFIYGLKKLNIPYSFLTNFNPTLNSDLILDASGFQFSDQWNNSNEKLRIIDNYYKKLKSSNAKIVFLPQAFGPFETKGAQKAIKIINKYADVIIAREKISYDFILNAGADRSKLWLYPDFTLLVNGVIPQKLQQLKNQVCIIPNKKMITHTSINSNKYLDFLENSIKLINSLGKKCFILNHEGEGDREICNEINARFNEELLIVDGLDAKEVKGVIGNSGFVISSRYHGVASALNQGVPCLATSWNHKYEMMFHDYGQVDKILNIENDWKIEKNKIINSFSEHTKIKENLLLKKKELSKVTQEMWERIWKLAE
jgi:polysaccharide pyruvyl transferase WcaK-like protein